jgi:hypothetical protein
MFGRSQLPGELRSSSSEEDSSDEGGDPMFGRSQLPGELRSSSSEEDSSDEEWEGVEPEDDSSSEDDVARPTRGSGGPQTLGAQPPLSRAASAGARAAQPQPQMVLQWRVLKKAKVKAGVELDSEKVTSLGVGAVVTALEQQGNRVRCSEGWISILAESGAVLLHRQPPVPVPQRLKKKKEKEKELQKKEKTSFFGRASKGAASVSEAAESDVADSDPEVSPRTSAMLVHHGKAQLEHVKNAMIESKRTGKGYKAFLEQNLPGDYHNEFVAGSRRNETWHELWDETSKAAPVTHLYTDATSNQIEMKLINARAAAEVELRGSLRQDEGGAATTAEQQQRHAKEEQAEREGALVFRFTQKAGLLGITFLAQDRPTDWPAPPPPPAMPAAAGTSLSSGGASPAVGPAGQRRPARHPPKIFVISEVAPGSLAARLPKPSRPRPGMVLSSVQGAGVAGLEFAAAMALIEEAGRPLELAFLGLPSSARAGGSRWGPFRRWQPEPLLVEPAAAVLAQAAAEAQAAEENEPPPAPPAGWEVCRSETWQAWYFHDAETGTTVWPDGGGGDGDEAGGGGGGKTDPDVDALAITAVFAKDSSLGITFASQRNDPKTTIVIGIAPGSAAAGMDGLGPGLMLSSVNGRPVEHLGFSETVELVQQAQRNRGEGGGGGGGDLTLVFKPLPRAASSGYWLTPEADVLLQHRTKVKAGYLWALPSLAGGVAGPEEEECFYVLEPDRLAEYAKVGRMLPGSPAKPSRKGRQKQPKSSPAEQHGQLQPHQQLHTYSLQLRRMVELVQVVQVLEREDSGDDDIDGLDDSKRVPRPVSAGAHVFSLDTADGKRLRLRALNAKQKQLWINAVRTCSDKLDAAATADEGLRSPRPLSAASPRGLQLEALSSAAGSGPEESSSLLSPSTSPVVDAIRESARAERAKRGEAERVLAAAADEKNKAAVELVAINRQLFNLRPLALDDVVPEGAEQTATEDSGARLGARLLQDPDEFLDCLSVPLKVLLGGAELHYYLTADGAGATATATAAAAELCSKRAAGRRAGLLEQWMLVLRASDSLATAAAASSAATEPDEALVALARQGVPHELRLLVWSLLGRVPAKQAEADIGSYRRWRAAGRAAVGGGRTPRTALVASPSPMRSGDFTKQQCQGLGTAIPTLTASYRRRNPAAVATTHAGAVKVVAAVMMAMAANGTPTAELTNVEQAERGGQAGGPATPRTASQATTSEHEQEAIFWLLVSLVEEVLPDWWSYSSTGLLGATKATVRILKASLAASLPRSLRGADDDGDEWGAVEAAVSSWLSKVLVTVLPLETTLRVWDLVWAQPRVQSDAAPTAGASVLVRAVVAVVEMAVEAEAAAEASAAADVVASPASVAAATFALVQSTPGGGRKHAGSAHEWLAMVERFCGTLVDADRLVNRMYPASGGLREARLKGKIHRVDSNFAS